MKLVNKFLLIYMMITVVVLSAGGVISYYLFMEEIDREMRFQFMDRIERIEYMIAEGRHFGFNRSDSTEKFERPELLIQELEKPVEDRVVATDTMAWNENLRRMERNVKVSAYRTINDKPYYISTWGTIVETDDIIEAVVKTLLWILGLQILGAVAVGWLVSGRLFKPFRDTLEKIRSFKLHRREPIAEKETGVREFNELNRFVYDMTSKAVSDYQNLKEFAENASHELQTPLSIAQGKLELLTETDLEPEQYRFVESAQRSIRKLSKLSESLGLLTKIENHEFSNSQKVNLTDLVTQSLEMFDELIALNGLTVEADLEPGIEVQMHPVLADILWTNLLQNAIKHNSEAGRIEILLDRDRLRISNTGPDLNVDPHDLFKRFKKGDQSTTSIGLGLSIVKRIVNQTDFAISYTFDENEAVHTLTVRFNGDAGSDA